MYKLFYAFLNHDGFPERDLFQGLGERSVLNGMWGKYDHHRALVSRVGLRSDRAELFPEQRLANGKVTVDVLAMKISMKTYHIMYPQ